MAITVSGLTVHTQTGAGTWKDTGGGGGSAANTDVFFSSTGSRARKVSNGIKGFALDLGAGGTDLSNTIIALRWAVLAGVGFLDSRTNGGVAITVEDTSGNISYFDIEGNDTYGGGWAVSAVSTSLTESRNNGTAATMTAVRYVGILWDMTGSVGGGDPNCYIDEIISWGNAGLTISGDSTSLVADLLSWDQTNDYGIFEERSGEVFAKTNVILSPNATGFSTSDETLIFEDPVYDSGATIDSALDSIGMSSSDTDPITFTRFTCVAYENPTVDGTAASRSMDFSLATDITVATATFKGFDATSTPAQLGGTGNSYTSVSFDGCGLVTHTGAVIRKSVFRNAVDANGAYEWTTSSDIQESEFVSDGSGHGISVASAPTSPSTTPMVSITFTSFGADNTADAAIDNNTGHNVTFDRTGSVVGAATVNTTSNLTVNVSVSLTIRGIPTGAEWRLYDEDVAAGILGTELDGEESKTGTDKIYSYNWSSDDPVVLQVMASGFEEELVYFDLLSTDRVIDVTLTTETNT